MPFVQVNGVRLFYERSGSAGNALVLVHGSWGDHHNWDAVVPELSKSFRVVTYDRRGHSLSERPEGQGSIREDVADLASLVEQLDIAPAHIVGNSGGAAVVLRLAGERPDLFRTLAAHEPPLFGLLASIPEASLGLHEVSRRIQGVVELLETGDHSAAARLFVETIALGPGEWDRLTEEMRRTFVTNAPTFLDETRDPESLRLDLDALRHFHARALLSHGTTSAPFFPLVVNLVANVLPNCEKQLYVGAGHVPHLTHPAEFVQKITAFAAPRPAPSESRAPERFA